MNNKFYIYIYLDPRKQGNFTYDDYKFEHEPFYIGKGKDKRCEDHLYEWSLKSRTLKNNKIKSLLRNDKKPIIIKLIESLTEEEAFSFERKIIKLIGRLDLKLGPLLNMTDGGDGSSGKITNEKTKAIISKSLLDKKIVRSKETKDKISKANTNREYSEDYINHLREIRKGPKLSHRNKYLIISPSGVKNELLGKLELSEFINKNELSIRKMIECINKDVITEKDIKNKNTKTNNCLGWKIELMKSRNE